MPRRARPLPTRGAAPALKRDSALPLYHQLAVRLEGEMVARNLEAGARFYTDRALVSRFGISLLTARQAVDQLVARGLLARRQGSGTYVTAAARRLVDASRAEAVVFSGWGPAALSGSEAMYFRDVFAGMREEAAARGMQLLFDDPAWRTPEHIAAAVRSLRLRGALILVGSGNRARAALFQAGGLPVLSVNEEIPGLPQVRPDDREGARRGTAHLIALGHRRLVHLNSGEATCHWREVRAGYLAALKEAGLGARDNPVLIAAAGCGSVAAGFEAMGQALARGAAASAVFAGNDLMAIGAIQRLHAAGRRVPDELSVLGFDGIEAGEFCVPPLSTMAVDRQLLGRRSVGLLLDGGTPDLVPVALLDRGTLARAPGRQPP
jgi:DNA-binding LacI/PurR family transcriptional regulator